MKKGKTKTGKLEAKNINIEIFNQYTEMKEKLGKTHGQMFELLFLQSQQPFRSGLSKRQETENYVRNWLDSGVRPKESAPEKITMYKVRKDRGGRLDVIRDIFELYKAEIEQFNEQF